MNTAKKLDTAVGVISSYVMGDLWVVVPCADYDAFGALPAAIWYDGKVCGRTGWNSDKGCAYYSSGRAVAFAAR